MLLTWASQSLANQIISGLFGAGEQGAFYDPSDFSTLFQDSAGTTPVTAAGEPVGRMLDKSGRGNHATQPTAAARPTLQQDASGFWHLATDGVDDAMQTAAFSLGGDKAALWLAVRKNVDTAQILIETGPVVDSTAGTFAVTVPATANYEFNLNGGTRIVQVTPTITAPDTSVLYGQFDMAAAISSQQTARRNGAAMTLTGTGTSSGAGPFTSQPLNLFSRNGSAFRFNGRFYGGIIRAGAPTAAQIALGERWCASRAGVSL